MLQQKIARLAADFAAEIVGMLTGMPLDDLVDDLTSARERSAPRPRAPSTPPKKRSTATARAAAMALPKRKARSATSPSAPSAPSAPAASAASAASQRGASSPTPEMIAAALAFFGERGSRGATTHQLGEHLGTLGFEGAASGVASVASTLALTGSIRDAGFRRAAGKNATSPVFVARPR